MSEELDTIRRTVERHMKRKPKGLVMRASEWGAKALLLA